MLFGELHVEVLARGVLEKGESLVAKTIATHQPWWALGCMLRQYVIFATDRRLILLDHRANLFGLWRPPHLFSFDSLLWSNVQEVKLDGLLGNTLRVTGQSERGVVKLSMKIPHTLFGSRWAMRRNFEGAKDVAQVFITVKMMASRPVWLPSPVPQRLSPLLLCSLNVPSSSSALTLTARTRR